ncbi:MAG: hypothetical protein J6S13_09060 [Clostridia bacterium]|nr:hypothetical protein [Clostridia bacterium]
METLPDDVLPEEVLPVTTSLELFCDELLEELVELSCGLLLDELPDGLLLEELLDEVVDEPPVEGELEVLPLEVLPLEVLLLEVLLFELPLPEVFDWVELLLPFLEELLSGSVAGLLGALSETLSEDGLPEVLLFETLLVDGASVGLPSDGFF